MQVVLNGNTIQSLADFHSAIANVLGFPVYYERNANALWDVMTGMLERPVKPVWQCSEASRNALGAEFEELVALLREIERADRLNGYSERFELVLD